MGSSFVKIEHIKKLLEDQPKNVHRLVLGDICPKDRQNYASLEKIMSDDVIKALAKVPQSEATIMYLQLCKKITSSYLDITMKPVDRIYNIWSALYFLRAWRIFILPDKNKDKNKDKNASKNNYRLKDNFITANAFQCVEINAHSLVYAILKLRKINRPQLFQPSLFSSQPCEATFRHMRSLGTPNYTKINFSLYELLHIVSRVELMESIKIAHQSSNEGAILFPIPEKRAAKNKKKKITLADLPTELPSDAEILTALQTAKDDALEDAKRFEMNIDSASISFSPLKPINEKKTVLEILNDEDFWDDDDDSEDDTDHRLHFYERHDYASGSSSEYDSSDDDSDANKFDEVVPETARETDSDVQMIVDDDSDGSSSASLSGAHSKHSKFVQIETEDGEFQTIKKSRLIWELDSGYTKLSSDRLYRVKATETIATAGPSSSRNRKKKARK